jgi:hypothetical protein
MRGIVTALLALATVAYSHGNHDQEDTSVETDWATRHMKGMLGVYSTIVTIIYSGPTYVRNMLMAMS